MSSKEIETMIESFGWRRSVAGDTDFDAAVHAIDTMMKSDRQGLIISGEYGCGKTTLMRIITRQLSPIHRVFLGVRDQERKLTDGYFEDFAIDPYRMHVFLDDLGAEKLQSDYGVLSELVADFVTTWEVLSAVRRRQNEPVKRLFITTNLTGEEIVDRYGGRFLSRLKDLCVPLKLTGHDKREWNI